MNSTTSVALQTDLTEAAEREAGDYSQQEETLAYLMLEEAIMQFLNETETEDGDDVMVHVMDNLHGYLETETYGMFQDMTGFYRTHCAYLIWEDKAAQILETHNLA